MSRRDMIIIATLVNAGLLAALFMLAVNTDDDRPSDPIEINQTVSENKPVEPPREVETLISGPIPVEINTAPLPATTPHDEMDNALNELASTNASQNIIIDDESNLEEENDDASPTVEKPITKATTTAAAPTAPSNLVEITVKRGDSLDKIARANGTTVAAIKEANDLKSDRLNIGQVLNVPAGKVTKSSSGEKTAKAKKSAEKSSIAQGDTKYHTVKSGDNPWKIAKQYGIKVDDLLKLNDLDEEKARNMKIGDKIRVR